MMSRISAWILGAALVVAPAATVLFWMSSAQARLTEADAAEEEPEVAVAAEANEAYCTPELRQILRRVLTSCGLIGSGEGGRGCQPADAKSVATMDDADFNALFAPMQGRGGIVQFEKNSSDLDDADRALVDRIFADRGGASYFFVVSRASPEGSVEVNRELSRSRAQNLMTHLQQTFHDPELEKQVGLLWLGEEYAQLDPGFCGWSRSGEEAECQPEDLNRSAFIAWIDCRL